MNIDLSSPSDRNLSRVLALQAQHNGDTCFLASGEMRYSFKDSNVIVNRYASGLKKLGIAAGDRVAIYMGSCVEYVFLTLAINKLGAIWVPINTDYRGDWLLDSINDSLAQLIVSDTEHLSALTKVFAKLNCKKLLVKGDNNKDTLATAYLSDFDKLDASEPKLDSIHYGDTAAILWTSGTTGKPKGVMQSHNLWICTAESGIKNFDTRAGDITYNCLPLYNSAAWAANIYRALVAGITCAMDPVFSVTTFWDRIRYYGATQTFTLGAMHIFLWQQEPKHNDRDNPLRVAQMVPMPEELLQPFCERFGIEKINQGYGQSEVMSLLNRNSDMTLKANSLGQCHEHLELKLLDDDGNEVAVGQTGEFCVRPKKEYIIFNGYFNNPEATEKAYFGEWYRTGDLGRMDEDGEYFFVDRKNDFIRYKGRNVSSMQVEAVALKHPAVSQAAVVGIPSEELASEAEIKLDVVLAPGQEVEPVELARFINDNAPYYFVPRFIELREALPYTPTNKIQKFKLREMGISSQTWDMKKSDFRPQR
ncbi:AMP-binding protein [Parahaliea sp. F7430]|uniref:AMP-binding protein n=1 Tax=Sediminihaliea albiluteola TaxID=2758564 RepID=A0A7W2TXM7_9GAMM|nr:AMP-binding protein [Sediminihaliea albiluteola]MBA6413699.1 AMP-binding protein [Sediminihaliea albiluteola]